MAGDTETFEAVADALVRVRASDRIKTHILAATMDVVGVPMLSVKRYKRDAAIVALLLDALGLTGAPQRAAFSPIALYTHGAQSGVDHHLAVGHRALCAACQRWVDVREGRRSAVCGEGLCGSVRAYWRHRNAKEPTCEWSRAAYREHVRERRAKAAGR